MLRLFIRLRVSEVLLHMAETNVRQHILTHNSFEEGTF